MSWRNALRLSHRTGPHNFEETCSKIVSYCNKQLLKEGICVHSPSIKAGFQDNLWISNNLLALYSKCHGVDHARHFFEEMPYKDVVSWSGLLSAYVKHGCYEEALELYDLMKFSGECPNEYTLSIVIRACSALRDRNQGTTVQACAIKSGFDSNPVLTSSLIDLYSKCDNKEAAHKIFMNMRNGDTVSWTTMISSFIQEGSWITALRLFICMIKREIQPNEYTYAKILSACGGLTYLNSGRLIHARMLVLGIRLNLVLKTALTDMYARCKRMEDAIKVSKQTLEQDTVLCTTLLSGFCHNLEIKEAVDAIQQMVAHGITPNSYTYAVILNGCSLALTLQLGIQFHSRVIEIGLENNVSVGNALIDMYLKCSGGIIDAFKVFEQIRSPNIISWTSLISGFVEHGLGYEAFQAFEKMQFAGIMPNSFTFSSILQACGMMKSANHTRRFHGYIIKMNIGHDIVVANALVGAYAGLHMVDDAWRIIGEMHHRDVITYTSVASKLNQLGLFEMALEVISYMQEDNIEMDGFTLSTVLSASASLGAIPQGKQLHCYAIKSGFSGWTSVSNGLIAFYGKCGCMHDVKRAFDEACQPDVVSWNSLIFSLAVSGHVSSALSTFEDMKLAGVRPDSTTILAVLSACRRCGLVDMALEYFHSTREANDAVPELEHYVCLVDLLGRAGRMQEAMAIIETMPFRPDALIYKTMLNACKIHSDVPLGEEMASRGLELEPCNPAFYLLLADMYENSGKSDLREKTCGMMKERGIIQKDYSNSWMEKSNKVPLLIAGDVPS
ncbi:unnamed protein product [Coffea canephora]|uniref:Pentacotripeptide-repeat region of PRORP domain-containing protein n=1 Tax=Coffea canephora TaxID=49390 RepID=A0A068UBV8_COFCA|nr:unnamed protein product [Coffea canephora]